MGSLLQPILDIHDYLTYDLPEIDKNDFTYPLLGSYIQLIGIVCLYYYFCTNLGPKMMKNRRPYELRTMMIVYNVFQVFGNLYAFIVTGKMVIQMWMAGENTLCGIRKNVIRTFPEFEQQLEHIAFFYVFLKVTDLLDTVFMVLKKNFRQITLLHVYHHATMPVASSLFYNFSYHQPTQSMWTGLPNMLVHVVMYSYYLITTFKPNFKKNIALKKSITILQLAQFVFVIIMNTFVTFQKDCPTSATVSVINYFQSCAFFALFMNFYIQTYVRPKKPKIN